MYLNHDDLGCIYLWFQKFYYNQSLNYLDFIDYYNIHNGNDESKESKFIFNN